MIFFKKLTFLLSLVVTLHAEAEIEITLHSANEISFATTQAPDAWIGIYKKGTSNDWKNVLKWDWVDDGTQTFHTSYLALGDYNARLFFNNSFISETSVDFHLIERPSNNNGKRFIDKTTTAYQNSLTLTLVYQLGRSEDWVGIFKQGEAYTSSNLQAWAYVSNLEREQQIKIFDKNGLSSGNYEIIYFTNNNYNSILGETAILTVEDHITYNPRRGTHDGKDVLRYKNLIDAPNNWIALFKRNAAPIKENILAWSYIRDGEILYSNDNIDEVYFSNIPTIGENDSLKVVLFKNDTYEIIAEDKTAGFD